MPTVAQPNYVLRQAKEGEAGMISYLRLASLLCLEMPGQRLAAIHAFMGSLPDIDAKFLAGGAYVVADKGGELIGGAGWSVLPLGFRSDRLLGENRRPVGFSMGKSSVLLRGFFLDPDMGRRGVGAALLAQIGAEVVGNGYQSAEIIVPAPSQLYYRSLGFRPAAKFVMELDGGDLLPLLQMRKSFCCPFAAAA